jgi:hypothetical protein
MNVLSSVAYNNKRIAENTNSNSQALIISEALMTQTRGGKEFIH